MSALHRKLLREMMRLWAQTLAIALVMAAGVATLLIGVGTYQSLDQTRESYYQENRFADIFATVTRAPRSLLAEIAEVDGVLAVDGRIQKLAVADIEGVSEPASVLLVSLPNTGIEPLNQVHLRSGRMPLLGAAPEALASEAFASANGFVAGSQLTVVMNGARRNLTLAGIGLSPEFVYAVPPGEIMPPKERFGVVWSHEEILAAAYGFNGAFNTVSIKLLPHASREAVIAAVDRLLAPYGGHGAYGREQQTSHAYLDSELKQLRSMSEVLPPVFLLVAAFLVNMTLTRLIALEREQIGLLKAIGYSAWAIAIHYVEFVMLIGIVGVVVGLGFGLWAGNSLTELYARFYSFPTLVFSRSPIVFVIAAGTTLGAAVIGASRAVRGAARLPPAVAMMPPAPPVYRNLWSDQVAAAARLRQTWIMMSRHLLHWPWRTAGGVFGLALAVAVLVGSLWSVGGVEYVIDYTFNRTERQDATITFAGLKPSSASEGVARLPGVVMVEPFTAVPVELTAGSVSRRIAIVGRRTNAGITRILDANQKGMALPDAGIVLTRALAHILRVGLGDTVDVRPLEGDASVPPVHVAGLMDGYIGLGAYMELGALQRLASQDGLISGVSATIDAVHQEALFDRLKQTPSIGQISIQTAALQQFRATMAQNLFVMMGVLVSLAGVIAFGVVYNFSRISLSEQGREMASLRVLGFTRGEVSRLLLAEIAVLTLLAQPIGWALGLLIAVGMVRGFSSELFTMPLVIGPEVFVYSSAIVVAAALVSGLIVRRRVDRLDLIAVLKTRE